MNNASGKFYGVHGALVWDYVNEETKIVTMRNELLVYNVDDPTPGYESLDLEGSPGAPVFPPDNGHQVFCSGYVPMKDGTILIVGGPFWNSHAANPDSFAVPNLSGPASIYDPTKPLTYAGGGFVGTQDLPDSSGMETPGTGCPNNALNLNRYYPTPTTLPDGRVLFTAGDFWNDCIANNVPGQFEYASNTRWIIYDPEASGTAMWEVQSPHNEGGGGFSNPWGSTMLSYPHVKMLPFGLFYAGNDTDAAQAPAAPSHLWWPLENWDTTTGRPHPKLQSKEPTARPLYRT